MGSIRLDRWLPAVIAVVAVGAVAVTTALDGSPVQAVPVLAGLAVLGWWSWPGRRGSHMSHAEAQARAGDDDVIVYWRPG